MSTGLFSRTLGVLVVATLVACGGGTPTALDACKKSCDKQGECTNATELAIFQCHSSCEDQKAQLSDQDTTIEHTCSNAGSVRGEIYQCYVDFCDTSLATNCANEAYQNHCVPK